MNKKQRVVMFFALARVLNRAHAGTIRTKGLGICSAVADEYLNLFGYYREGDDVYIWLAKLFKGWPEHSGMADYPIPIVGFTLANSTWKWEGEQLALRIDLIEYAMDKLVQHAD